MPTLGTAIDMPTHGSRSAVLYSQQHLHMLPPDPVAAVLNEALAGFTDDVGHLYQWLAHFFTRFLDLATSSGRDI